MGNCTEKDLFWAAADYTGTINGQSICSVGDCCAHLIGKYKSSEDSMDWTTTISDKSAAGLCGDMTEENYCIFIGGDFHHNCMEYILSPTERLAIHTCFDGFILYYLSCPVFKQSYTVRYLCEPPLYFDQLTAETVLVFESVINHVDKICHPHSYYNPASVKDSESATTESSTISLDSSSSGSHAAVVASFLYSFLA